MTLTHRFTIAILSLFAALAIVLGAGMLGYANADDGSGSAVLAPATSALPAAPAAAEPSPSVAWSLYKEGHLVPAIIVGAFVALTLLQSKIAWLKTGYRKLAIASALAGLGMLLERAMAGTTPNLGMVMGALGAALTAWMKTEGDPKPDTGLS